MTNQKIHEAFEKFLSGNGISVNFGLLEEAFTAGCQAALSSPPEGWKLLKDSTLEERSWPEDYAHENGHYFNTCYRCQRQFMGHKRRVSCKVCVAPSPSEES